MSFFAWILLGFIAGFVGRKLINRSSEGLVLDILLGVVGAIIGSWLFSKFGIRSVTGLNLYSMMVAIAGAVILLVGYHAIRRAAV